MKSAALLTAGIFLLLLVVVPGLSTIADGQIADAMMRLRQVQPPPDQIVIVATTRDGDASIKAGSGRSAVIEAIDIAQQAGAAAIAVDHLLTGSSPDDPRFSELLNNPPKTVLAIAPKGGAGPPSDALRRALIGSAFDKVSGAAADPAGDISYPIAPVDQLLGSADLGHVAVATDPDGVLRQVAMGARVGSVILPFLPLAALGRDEPLEMGPDGVRIGDDAPHPLGSDGWLRLSYYGPEGSIPTLSLDQAREHPERLRGRIVFVGSTAIGFGDRHTTPMDVALPGVEVLATTAANLLQRSYLLHGVPELLASCAIGFGLGFAVIFGFGRLPPVLAFCAAFCVVLAGAGVIWLAFLNGHLLFPAEIGLVVASAAALAGGRRMRTERRAARNLERFTDPGLRGVLREHGGLTHGDEEIEAAALCIDVVGFAARSDKMTASGTAEFLSLFHGAVEQAVLPHGGVVEHYTGDGVMVIFGLTDRPLPRQDAANAARQLEVGMAALNQTLTDQGVPACAVRITGHAGRALPVVLGGQQQRHITITGPVLTGAARLQDVAKSLGAEVLFSAAFCAGDTEGLTDYGLQDVRGWREALHCFGRQISS